ncbi:type I glutamate--ammonia ligase, partial [Micromonospora saelicesensis]
MAGLDGIKSKIEPPTPIDKDLYDLPPEEWGDVKQVPGSLAQALDSLAHDHDYLLDGGVFSPDLISTWVAWKRANEVEPMALRPTPHEFALYFDC